MVNEKKILLQPGGVSPTMFKMTTPTFQIKHTNCIRAIKLETC